MLIYILTIINNVLKFVFYRIDERILTKISRFAKYLMFLLWVNNYNLCV